MRLAFVRVISIFDFEFNVQITPVRKSPQNVASTAKKRKIIGLIINSIYLLQLYRNSLSIIERKLHSLSFFDPLPLLILSAYIVDSNFQP